MGWGKIHPLRKMLFRLRRWHLLPPLTGRTAFWVLGSLGVYVLSVGPAVCLYHYSHHSALRATIPAIYAPLTTLARHCSPFDELLRLYVSFWTSP